MNKPRIFHKSLKLRGRISIFIFTYIRGEEPNKHHCFHFSHSVLNYVPCCTRMFEIIVYMNGSLFHYIAFKIFANVIRRNTMSVFGFTDRSKAVVLLWLCVVCFGVRVWVTFNLMFVHIILVRFGLLSGHLLGKSCSLG